MSSLWDSEADEWMTAAPEREDIALSMAHKIVLLIGIMAMIVGLWALTAPQTTTQTDATLAPAGAGAQQVSHR
ncbi:MAG: hypothetical protein U0R64_06715 [Candidatus Nanopelagicales bacterium]